MSLLARTTAAVVTAAVLAGLLSACYPHSHEYTLTPEFSGVLLDAGAPMSGVTVMVSHTRGDAGNYCINPRTVAVTDHTGAFRVPPQTSTHHFTSLLNPPKWVHQMTSICFQALGKHKLGALVLAPTDHEERYEMACDWESPAVEFKQRWQADANQWGICKRPDAVMNYTRAYGDENLPWKASRWQQFVFRPDLYAQWDGQLKRLYAEQTAASTRCCGVYRAR